MICVNGEVYHVNTYPDGSLSGHTTITMNNKRNEVRWDYEGDHEFFAVICTISHIKRRMPESQITLFVPYLPHARMDRIENECDVFTLKHFCEAIYAAGAERIRVVDVHSDAIKDLFPGVVLSHTLSDLFYAIGEEEVLAQLPIRRSVLVYPDAGAAKKYSQQAFFKENAGVLHGVKERDWDTGKIIGYGIPNVETVYGKDVVIIDDICSCGRTFISAAKMLREAGARTITVFATHCEDTVLKGEITKFDLIDVMVIWNPTGKTDDGYDMMSYSGISLISRRGYHNLNWEAAIW